MAKVWKIIIILLVAALLVIVAGIIVLSEGYGWEGDYMTPVAGLDKSVLDGGRTIRLTVRGISNSDVDFSACKIAVHTPAGHSDVLNLSSIAWIGNDSVAYAMPDGYNIALNRTSVHDHLSSGDRIEISSLGEKLAAGTWSITIIDSYSGGAIAGVQQVIA